MVEKRAQISGVLRSLIFPQFDRHMATVKTRRADR